MLHRPMFHNPHERTLWEQTEGLLIGWVGQHEGWLRLGEGWGVQWKSSLVPPRLYSERTGRRCWLHVGPWRLRLLRPIARLTINVYQQPDVSARQVADEVVWLLNSRVMTRR